MTSDTYQETIVSHDLANLFQEICSGQFSKKTRQEIHITKKKMQTSDVCSTSKVSIGKKHAQKEDKTFNQALLALPTTQGKGYPLYLDSL
jgi:hypothetical protein